LPILLQPTPAAVRFVPAGDTTIKYKCDKKNRVELRVQFHFLDRVGMIIVRRAFVFVARAAAAAAADGHCIDRWQRPTITLCTTS
jgi:hypothetical protein